MKSVLRVLATVALVGCAALLVSSLWQAYVLSPWTRDGRVSADVVQIVPEVSGHVVEVAVRDNQLVHKGDLLYRIDPERFQIALDAAQAALRGRRADLEIKASISHRRNTVGEAVLTGESLDQGNGELKIAQAAYDSAVAAAQIARLNLQRASVHAPVDGYVTNLKLRPGDYAVTGATKLAIIDAASFWVTGYFEETKLARVAVGSPVAVRLMGTDAVVTGHVGSIGHGIADANDNTDHRGLPTVNPVFTWVRLAQRIPVRIELDHIPQGVKLTAGMTCSVDVGDDMPRGLLQTWLQKYL